jgi:hypothetical protein
VTESATSNLTNKTTTHAEELVMDVSASAILAETYILHMEHKQLYLNLIKYQITVYFRYVDDIFIIYKQTKTNIEETLAEFNRQQTNIKLPSKKKNTILLIS